MATPFIKTADKDNIESIVSSIVIAFSVDPIARWIYPSSQQYLKNFPDFVKIFGTQPLKHQSLYCTDDYVGAALWFPPQIRIDNDAIGGFIQQTISGQRQEEIFAVLEQMESYHPHEPHWYLAIMGVETNQQNQGYGSALMKHKLEECDRTNTIAYLESSKPNNIPFYEKHGFKVIGEIQAGESPTIFPMLRYP